MSVSNEGAEAGWESKINKDASWEEADKGKQGRRRRKSQFGRSKQQPPVKSQRAEEIKGRRHEAAKMVVVMDETKSQGWEEELRNQSVVQLRVPLPALASIVATVALTRARSALAPLLHSHNCSPQVLL